MMKKFIAGVLSAVMCTSVVLSEADSFSTRSPETAAGQTADNGDSGLQGKNSLSDYIAQKAANPENRSGQQAVPLSQSASQSQEQVYAVTFVDFNSETGDILAASTQSAACRLLVSFINQDDPSDVYTVEADVKAGESVMTELTADLSRIPEFYTIKAQLVNALGLPIGDSYLVSDHTRQVQEIRDTDITAFDQEQVVNLDDSNDTNFLVLNENTVKAESTDTVNTLVSADYDNNIYVFDNIDDTVRNLESGAHFFAQPCPEEIVALIVDDIQIDGDTATLSGEDAVDEMFDFIKIESSDDNYELLKDYPILPEESDSEDETLVTEPEEATSDDPAEESAGTESENAEAADPAQAENAAPTEDEEFSDDAETEMETANQKYLGMHAAELDPLPDPYWTGDLSQSNTFTLKHDFKGKKKILKVTPSISFSIAHKLNFYKSFGYLNITLNTETTLTYGVTATASNEETATHKSLKSAEQLAKYLTDNTDDIEKDLGSVTIPTGIPGVDFKITVGVKVLISGSITLSETKKIVAGFSYDSDRPKDDRFQKQSAEYTTEDNFKLEGKITIAVTVSIEAELVKLVKLGISFSAGFTVTVQLKDTAKIKDGKITTTDTFLCIDTSGNTKHSCDTSLEGELFFEMTGTIYLDVGFKKWETLHFRVDKNIFKINLKICDWHCCFDEGGTPYFGLGKCPRIAYKTTFNLKDGDGWFDPSGHTIELHVDSNTYDMRYAALSIYSKPGTHSYSVVVDGTCTDSGTYVIRKSAVTVNANANPDNSQPHDPSDKQVDGPEETTAPPYTTTARPNTTVTHYQILKTQKNEQYIKLGDHIDGTLSGDGTLSVIGYGDMYNFTSSPFNNPKLIRSVEFDDYDPEHNLYITSIGDYVFDGASNMTEIYLTNKIRRIGDWAFRNCSSLPGFRYGGQKDKSNVLKLPTDLQYIGNYAFENCSSANFGDVVISDIVTYVGTAAFRNCQGLTYIEIPGSVTAVGAQAFHKCQNLTEAVIHDGVGEIGRYTFNECISLESLTIPYAGNTLKTTNDGSAEPVYSWFFNGAYAPEGYYNANGHGIPAGLTKITVTGGRIIPDNSFSNMINLEEIIYPDDIT
ncbi:MAG: leucine-rich repeat domain-containing protein, partial [Oscillospiraceae bacterium]|nr:leucine-rich repeat domain-containing protein [Oscillospiraceae bacterium]